jgi:hypothetical protein
VVAGRSDGPTRNLQEAVRTTVIAYMERFLPWYAGPDWPTPREMSMSWLLVAAVVTVSALVCWIEFGAWRYGFHTISYTSQHSSMLRWSVFALIAAAGMVGCLAWLQHTNGSYGGP